jgi:4-amino-4-deoxy-L-arabinose transferase-like glycosyltransferase
MLTQIPIRQRLALAAILLLTALAVVPDNSNSRRLSFHELLVAQTASEMLQRGDFLVPHFLDEPRLKKPPLSYWLSAAAHRLLGNTGDDHVSEFEARLPSLLSALLLVLVTFGLGTLVIRDPRGGLIAAAILATSAAFFSFARSARPEMIYALLCTLMVFGLVLVLRRAEAGRSTFGAAALTWAAFALSLLAKGPQFPLFIFFGMALTWLLHRPRMPLAGKLHAWMALPALLIPLAYYAYLALQVEDALSLWGSEMVQGEDVPLWQRPLRLYYPAVLMFSMAPWLVAFAATVVDAWKHRDREVLFLINSVLVSLLLVSFAGKLREHYVLPLLPMCAVLIAATLRRAIDAGRDGAARGRWTRLLVWGQYGLLGIVVAGVIVHHLVNEIEPGDVPSVPLLALFLGLAAILYLAAGVQIGRNLARAFALLSVASLIALGALPWTSFQKSDNTESAYRFIRQVEETVPANGRLYLDDGKHMLTFERYYGRGQMQSYRLEDWIESGEKGPAPYFVSTYGRVRDLGIAGEIVVGESHDGNGGDNARVLFRPASADASG